MIVQFWTFLKIPIFGQNLGFSNSVFECCITIHYVIPLAFKSPFLANSQLSNFGKLEKQKFVNQVIIVKMRRFVSALEPIFVLFRNDWCAGANNQYMYRSRLLS